MGWELDEVERPFVEQLRGMGWRHVEGSLDRPADTGRASFTEVIHEATLRRQLNSLNLDAAGQPWLTTSASARSWLPSPGCQPTA